MATLFNTSVMDRIHPILGAIQSTMMQMEQGGRVVREAPAPFVTISRQAGAGGWALGQRLVERLNSVEADAKARAWTAWDRELVEKVAADHHIQKRLVETLEESRHTWFGDFLAGLSPSNATPEELKIFHCVATTIRGLALAGRVVIVGCSGVFVTRRMEGGIHIRLVAPLEHRVQYMMKLKGFTRDAAREYVIRTDRNRAAFFKRYWSREVLSQEQFALTINTAQVGEKELLECVVALVRGKEGEFA